MEKDRWTKMESLIEQALALAPDEREIFLRHKCGDDEALRNELESLLEDSETAFQFIRDLAEDVVTPELPVMEAESKSPSESELQDLSGETVAHYRVIEKLGSGGMGVVYKAFDTRLERIVALKFLSSHIQLSDKSKQRFLREAKAAAAMNHPNICHIHSIGEHRGQHFIDMEYMEGITLRETITNGLLLIPEATGYAKEILKALSAAHNKGIVHRDIKPENIMLDRNQNIKIMDFGLAKLKGGSDLTGTGGTIGTIAYMSPEQIRGREPEVQSDLFSFGIVIYEMLTGRHPFKAALSQITCHRILHEDPPLPGSIRPEIPSRLDALVGRCLQKDPDRRFGSAKEILEDLEAAEDSIHREAREDSASVHRIPDTGQARESRFRSIATSSSFWVILTLILAGFFFYTLNYTSIIQEPIPSDRHIVVLPFYNLSEELVPVSLNDGITEYLTSKITQLEMGQGSLWVVPSSEVRDQQVASVAQASRLFGANLAVTGSLARDGDRFRLTLNLVDGGSLRQLRSRVLELEWTDFARLQDEIVDALVEMLEIEIAPDAIRSIRAGSSKSSLAYQLYIEGLGYLSRHEDPENVKTAIRIFREAVQSDTTFARAYSKLAEAYWRKFDLTRDTQWTQPAIHYGQKALELNDRVPEVYMTQSLIYNGMGRHEDALEILDLHDEIHPPNYSALVERARAYEGRGMFERAEEQYRRAIDQKNTFWDGYHRLGVFYYRLGNFDKAAEMFRKVNELTPDNIRAFNNLGGVYMAMEKTEDAVQAFERSLELQPNHRALLNLGTHYFYQRNYEEASRYYEKATGLIDTDYRIWGYLGFSLHWSGQDSSKVISAMEQAIQLAEKEQEIRPNDDVLLSQLAGYYFTVGDREKVQILLRQLHALDVLQPETKSNMAHLYEQLGERDTAVHWLAEALRQGYRLHIVEALEGMQELLGDPRISELSEKLESTPGNE